MSQEKTTMEQVEQHAMMFSREQLNDNTLEDNLSRLSFQQPQLSKSPRYDAGLFDALPLELLHLTLVKLDLRCLMNFRYVNRRSAELVDSQPQYKAIAKYARSAIRGVLSIQTGAWITCERLYDKLVTPECEVCGDFAGYLYLITCRRVCFICFSENDSFLPLGVNLAKRRYGLRRDQIHTLPRVKIVPGTYSPGESTLARRDVLYDYDSILSAALLHHGSQDAVNEYMFNLQARMDEEHILKYHRAREKGLVSPRLPPKLFPPDLKSTNPRRFAAIVPMPYLNRFSMRLEDGFHCASCRNHTRRPLHWRRLFTTTSFAIHLRECGRIREGKHVLENQSPT